MGGNSSKSLSVTNINQNFVTDISMKMETNLTNTVQNNFKGTCDQSTMAKNTAQDVNIVGNGNSVEQNNELDVKMDCIFEQESDVNLSQAMRDAITATLNEEIDNKAVVDNITKQNVGLMATGTNKSSNTNITNIKVDSYTAYQQSIKKAIENNIKTELVASMRQSVKSSNTVKNVNIVGNNNSFKQKNKVTQMLAGQATQKALSQVVTEVENETGLSLTKVSRNSAQYKNSVDQALTGIEGICAGYSSLVSGVCLVILCCACIAMMGMGGGN